MLIPPLFGKYICLAAIIRSFSEKVQSIYQVKKREWRIGNPSEHIHTSFQ